ncbi:MAG: FAD-dependent monooxygenase [Myxococcota bacterium]
MIIGGGPVGLATSALLSRFGVGSCLVERHAQTTYHPKARNLNVRSSEIVRPWGIDARLRDGGLPPHWGRQFVYTRTLSSAELGRMRTGSFAPVEEPVSPTSGLLSSQDRIEPVLREYAESFGCADVRFGCELADFEIGDHGVTATLAGENAPRARVHARYLVGADGASSLVRERLGIALEGPQGIGSFINVYFRADLARWTDERPAVLYWISEPGNTGVLQPLDGKARWLCQIAYDRNSESVDDYSRERCTRWIRRAVGSEEFELEILSIGSWTMNAAVATSLRVGPVFLVGDAAHQLPPTGGFGMNTGLQDAHNLAWKLAGVLDGWATDRLLDTYETERRPVARYNTQRSLENAGMVGRVNASVLRGTDAGAEVSRSRRYGNFLGMDLGFAYEAGAVVPDGTAAPEVEDEVVDYVPTARPGHRAPHTPLGRDGEEISTLDLFDRHFVLLAGPEGEAWCKAAAAIRGRVPLESYRVARDGDLSDPGGRWLGVFGIERGGAVLVRPDGHVAWRAPRGTENVEHVLSSVLSRLALVPGQPG